MYNIGEFVIYGSSGVCEITDITDLQSQGMEKGKLYYLMIPIAEKGSRIYAAVNGANVGMRRVMTKEEAYQLIDAFPEIGALKVSDEKNKERCYQEIIRKSDSRQLASMIKLLYARRCKRLSEGKKSTAADSKYFKMAENNLYAELGFAIGEAPERIPEIIQNRITLKEGKQIR